MQYAQQQHQLESGQLHDDALYQTPARCASILAALHLYGGKLSYEVIVAKTGGEFGAAPLLRTE